MKKVIVTTTINPPTEAIRSFDAMEDWELIVVGDRKTPEYKLNRGRYVSWEEQERNYSDLCELIGPDSVRRGRMIAFIEAHKSGANIVASIDDDNYPMADWGKDVSVGSPVEVRFFETQQLCFDPLHEIGLKEWHRGFPVELRHDRLIIPGKMLTITPLIQTDLWTGDIDVDATVRLFASPDTPKIGYNRFSTNTFSPVNTQNTFILGKYLRDFYANIPFIGRMDDIWSGYLFESMHPNSVLYGHQTVCCKQDRSTQSIIHDLQEELFGYKNTLSFLNSLRSYGTDEAMRIHLPRKSIAAIELYRSYFE